MFQLAETLSFAILPLTDVDLTIAADHSTSLIHYVVLPVAFIETAIGPDTHATALSDVSISRIVCVPFSKISRAILEFNQWFALQISIKPHFSLRPRLLKHIRSILGNNISHFLHTNVSNLFGAHFCVVVNNTFFVQKMFDLSL